MIWLLQTFQNPSPCTPSSIHAPIMPLPPSVAPTSHLYVAPYTLPALCKVDSFSLLPSRSQMKCQYLQKALKPTYLKPIWPIPVVLVPLSFLFPSHSLLIYLLTWLLAFFQIRGPCSHEDARSRKTRSLSYSVLDPHHLAQSLTLADAQKMFVKWLSKFLRCRPNLSYFLNHSTI